MNLNKLREIKNKFKEETGLDLYQAMAKFYAVYPLENGFYSDEDALSMDGKTVESVADLVRQVITKNVRKNSTNTKQLNKGYELSFDKSLGGRLTPNVFHVKGEKLFKASYDAIIENLVKNPTIAFNPVILLSGKDIDRCRCIFEPSKDFFRRNKSFIKKEYSGNSHIVTGYSINVPVLKETPGISIDKEDILNLYYCMYDIYVWGLIALGDFQSLISMGHSFNSNLNSNEY